MHREQQIDTWNLDFHYVNRVCELIYLDAGYSEDHGATSGAQESHDEVCAQSVPSMPPAPTSRPSGRILTEAVLESLTNINSIDHVALKLGELQLVLTEISATLKELVNKYNLKITFFVSD